MTTATAKRAKQEPMSLEEAAAAKMRETLQQYRDRVVEAADGKAFYAAQLEIVDTLLSELGLPRYAWQRDVDALKHHRQLMADVTALEATRQDDADEAAVLNAEIKALECRRNQARGRLHELTTVRPQTIAAVYQRLHELEANHPHTLGDIGKAVEIKMAAQQRKAERLPKTGWLMT